MNQSLSTEVTLHGLRPDQYPHIDIDPVFIQYMVSFIIILAINFIALYQFTLEMWKIYSQKDIESIIHDIYDKMILHTQLKYVFINITCIIYFHDITSPPVQIIRMFWLYCLVIVFMKFDIKQIFWPALNFFCAISLLAIFWIWLYGELPAFKIILVETLVIIYYGSNQSYQITKILNFFNKQKINKTPLSLQTLLQKNNLHRSRNDYDSLIMNLQLDEHIIRHLQNRRSFCLVFCSVLIIDLILLLDLQAGKQLLGEVFLSVVLDILPLYVVFWYLRKSGRQKEQVNKRLSKKSQSQFYQLSNNRKSKIIIQMVNLKT